LPLKLLLRFRAEKPFPLSLLRPKTVHGLLFALVRNTEVGDLLHRGGLKPFSLSFPSHFLYPSREVGSFALVLNLLDNSIFPKLARRLFFPEEGSLEVAGVRVRLVSVKPLEVVTYSDLLKGGAEKDLLLNFLSPTAFKRGVADYPLPDPYLVFSSLLRRWNAFSPRKLPTDLYGVLKERVHLSGCWIKTRKVEVAERAKFTGFTGRVLFYLDLEGEPLRQVNALARLASFAGVGRKTTMGFGTVKVERRVEES